MNSGASELAESYVGQLRDLELQRYPTEKSRTSGAYPDTAQPVNIFRPFVKPLVQLLAKWKATWETATQATRLSMLAKRARDYSVLAREAAEASGHPESRAAALEAQKWADLAEESAQQYIKSTAEEILDGSARLGPELVRRIEEYHRLALAEGRRAADIADSVIK